MTWPVTWDSQDCPSVGDLTELRISLTELSGRVWRALDADNVLGLAAQSSYYFVLALFPFLIFLAAVVAYLPVTGVWEKVLTWVTLNLPQESQHLVLQTVASLIPGRERFLSFGLFGTCFAATCGFMNLMNSLNVVYEVRETRSYWRRLGLAFVILSVINIMFLATFALLSESDRLLGNWLVSRDGTMIILWQVARWVLSLGLLALAVTVLDYALPNLRRPWCCFTPGTLFVVLAWMPATLGFNLYVLHFGSYNTTYGALGTFVVLMIWMYIGSLIVLTAAEINCELHKWRAEANLNLHLKDTDLSVASNSTRLHREPGGF